MLDLLIGIFAVGATLVFCCVTVLVIEEIRWERRKRAILRECGLDKYLTEDEHDRHPK